MRYENVHEVMAAVKTLSIGAKVNISKNKRAKTWKVIGIIKALPLLEGEGGQQMQYIVANKNKVKYVKSNQILEVIL